MRCILPPAVSRLRPSMWCGRCCCRRFTRFNPSGSWSSSCTKTGCSAGSLAWVWTTRRGSMRFSEESRSSAYVGRGAAVLRRSQWSGEALDERRAFHRRRRADPGLGLAAELPAQGRLGRWRRHKLPWAEEVERDPPVDHRSGVEALQKGAMAKSRSRPTWAMRWWRIATA